MIILVSIFGVLALATLLSRFEILPFEKQAKVEPELHKGHTQSTLFVVIHGLDRGKRWDQMLPVLRPHGDALTLTYSNPLFSNADPQELSDKLAGHTQTHFAAGSYDRVVLIGQSMGALLAKRAFVDAEEAEDAWAENTKRIVLVAGMNRGWDISGQKPSDMGHLSRFTMWAGAWAARLVGFGKLPLAGEAGAPFVANLRLDWINRMAKHPDSKLEVVQLLGDIDDLVSAEDNKDLRALGSDQFCWIKVRGTGHSDIVDFENNTDVGGRNLGDYRREKFQLAATETEFEEVRKENEVLAFQPDREATHVVFVVHGIRDLGAWSAGFETDLKNRMLEHEKNDQGQGSDDGDAGGAGGLRIESPRYGYFGMGPFLLKPVREKYVKWLMDEYTEIRARYPNAKRFDFIGHSNGTYLLANALERYDSLDMHRIVFAGSVVHRDYDWLSVLGAPSGKDNGPLVVNYTAADDWVVALFPRFFEPCLAQSVFKNDIGSAGFNGFRTSHPGVTNIGGLTGGHSAFLNKVPAISEFILDGKVERPVAGDAPREGIVQILLRWGSCWATWVIVWPFIAFLLIMVGWHVVSSAPEPRWPMFLAYVTLILMILRHV